MEFNNGLKSCSERASPFILESSTQRQGKQAGLLLRSGLLQISNTQISLSEKVNPFAFWVKHDGQHVGYKPLFLSERIKLYLFWNPGLTKGRRKKRALSNKTQVFLNPCTPLQNWHFLICHPTCSSKEDTLQVPSLKQYYKTRDVPYLWWPLPFWTIFCPAYVWL